MKLPTAAEPNQKILRRSFLFLCILPFLLIPVLCLDAGISGDEPVHYQHAEHVYRYFASDGADRSAIETPVTFLKFYGQSIDNFSQWINRIFNFREPYLTRHIINALAGALTVLFSALLAVEISGYGAGILAILFLMLSPVFLGHSYNNLKDIPFALGYVASLFFLIKFIRGLPHIHAGYLIGIAAGAGFAISIRIGGLVILPIVLCFSTWAAWHNMPDKGVSRDRFWLALVLALSGTAIMAFFPGSSTGRTVWRRRSGIRWNP